MSLNGDNFGADTSVDLTLGNVRTTINVNGSVTLPCLGGVAVQSEAIAENHIANVVFTIAWYTAEWLTPFRHK